MNNKRFIVILIFTMLIINLCRSQTRGNGNVLPPAKVELNFDSLYPHAYDIDWHLRQKGENAQSVTFNCNCQEGLGIMTVTFDTSGHIIKKAILISENTLPQVILDYVTSNYPSGFMYGATFKIIDKSEISYTVNLLQATPAGDAVNGGWTYILKFTAKGEFISLDKK